LTDISLSHSSSEMETTVPRKPKPALLTGHRFGQTDRQSSGRACAPPHRC
jgi:hypothetical protein